jgi:hypothetical protein
VWTDVQDDRSFSFIDESLNGNDDRRWRMTRRKQKGVEGGN